MPEITNCILFVHRFAKFHQLGTQVRKDVGETSGVAARMRKVFGQPHGDGIADADEHNGGLWTFDALPPLMRLSPWAPIMQRRGGLVPPLLC
jgi:hypothetical protein